MTSLKLKHTAGWVLSIAVGAMFLLAGLGKLTGAAAATFAGWGYASWFATTIGALEVMGAAGLLVPRLTRAATLGLTGIMIGAVYTHIANGEGAQVLRPLIFTALMWSAGWLRGR